MRKKITAVLALVLAFLLLGLSSSMAETIADVVGETEKPVLHQLNINVKDDYNTYPTALILEEATGYHVEYDMLPSEKPMDKLSLIMAGHENYDIIVIGGDVDAVMGYARSGALLDLTPYLPLAPKLNAAINDYERETFTIDGKLYAIGMQSPAFNGRGQINNTVFIRQDYLDQLGMELPETLDDFVEMLRALKEFDNGTEAPTIPLTISSGDVYLACITGAFGIPNEWNEVDGRLVPRAEDPRTLEYLDFMKELYQEGLIDIDYPANKASNVYEKFSTGVAACAYLSCYNYSNFGDSMKEMQPESKIAYMQPLTGPDGDCGVGVVAGGMDRIAFIPAWCQNIEHVINYMEMKLEQDTFENVTIGQEGVHFTVDENGERWPILPIFTQERGNSVNYYTGRPAEEYADYWKLRVKKRADIWDAWSYMNLKEPFVSKTVVSMTGYAPNFASSSNAAALSALEKDMAIKIVAGDSTTAEYSAFLDEWHKEGGTELVNDYNTWWESYNQ